MFRDVQLRRRLLVAWSGFAKLGGARGKIIRASGCAALARSPVMNCASGQRATCAAALVLWETRATDVAPTACCALWACGRGPSQQHALDAVMARRTLFGECLTQFALGRLAMCCRAIDL